MHATDCNLRMSKITEAVILLNLIATLRIKSHNTNKVKIDVHMYNKEIWRRKENTTKVENHFNQDSTAEIIAVKIMMKEVDLNIMLKIEQGHREVRQTFQQHPGPKLIKNMR